MNKKKNREGFFHTCIWQSDICGKHFVYDRKQKIKLLTGHFIERKSTKKKGKNG